MSSYPHPISARKGLPVVAIALAIVIAVAVDRRNGTILAAR